MTDINPDIIDTTATETPPPTLVEAKEPPKNGSTKKPKADKTDKEIGDDLGIGGGGARLDTKPLKDLQISEDMNIKEIVEALGQSGAFKIAVSRIDPTEVRDPQTGRLVKCGGHLKTYDHAIDEEIIQQRHGGGKFELRFNRRGRNGGYPFLTARRIEVAGEPNLDELRQTMPPAAAAPAPTQNQESPSVVARAMEVMERQLDKERTPQHAPVDVAAITAPLQQMIASLQQQMTAQRESSDKLISELRADLAAARAFKPPEDPVKEKLLGSLIDGESGRITSLRLQHESEMRTLKANAIEDEKRLRDSFDRDKSSLIASFDRERQTMMHSHEMTIAGMKSSHDTQIKVLDGQIRALERDNSELRTEVKELRAKKEKSLVEQVKEIQVIKDTLGLDEQAESGVVDKIAEVMTDPNATALVGSLFSRKKDAAAQQQAAQQQAPQGPPPGGYQRQIVKSPDGQQWVLEPDGKLTGPVRRRGKSAASEPDIPVISPETISQAVNFLERAFEGGADPETVATGAKSLVPAEVIQVLADHGPDVFMTKVAKIPLSSPLSSQEAKNWIRKLSKAIVG